MVTLIQMTSSEFNPRLYVYRRQTWSVPEMASRYWTEATSLYGSSTPIFASMPILPITETNRRKASNAWPCGGSL